MPDKPLAHPGLWLVDYEAQILSGELAPLAPYLLEIVPRPTEETVQTAKKLALQEPDDERRTLLLSLVALLAGRYFDKETVRTLLRQEVDMVRTNTFFDDWFDEAEQKGLEEGREKGRLEERRVLLLRLLEHRFGAVPVRLVLAVQEVPADFLSDLFDLALTVPSLVEIEQAIEKTRTAIPA